MKNINHAPDHGRGSNFADVSCISDCWSSIEMKERFSCAENHKPCPKASAKQHADPCIK